MDRRFGQSVSRDGANGHHKRLNPCTLFVIFRLTFTVTTPALIVGGFAERMRFSAMPPHNLIMTVTGAGMLRAGWFGLNEGRR